MTPRILAIDQGTNSSRVILFDAALRVVTVAQEEFPQHFPVSGWVEHDPSNRWSTVAGTARGVIEKAGLLSAAITAIGITNQRETIPLWAHANCAADFGTTRADVFEREIPILGVTGDQQSGTIGRACFAPGMMTSTCGTGCFALLNTGDQLVAS